MTDLAAQVARLRSKNQKEGHAAMQLLQRESEQSDAVYAYFDEFAALLDSAQSYERTRGLTLIAANARWDADCKIDELIDRYLSHVTDPKPITARQCIAQLPALARCKPDLRDDIVRALRWADTDRYAGSMRPLVQKDIQNALAEIGEG